MALSIVSELVAPLSLPVATTGKETPEAVSIAGRTFYLDLGPESPYTRVSAQTQKQQQDASKEFGEQSIGDGWWRRSQSDFSGGSGQKWLDKENSDRSRFLSSKGIDVFGIAPEIQCLKGTSLSRASANTNLYACQAGSYIYLTDGNAIVRNSDPFTPASYTSITAGPAAAATSICSDGSGVYTSYSANGIYRSPISGTTTATWSAQNATLVRWAKQRIMCANANILYECDNAGVATARHTHYNSGWVWTDVTEIGPAILAAGYVGEQSTIFRSTIATDGTLGTFVEATEGGLPDGEIINCIKSYLGFVFIGTNLGVRMASHDTDGNLTYGPLVPVDTQVSVKCFEPQDSFVWFGWTNYDATSTGLGRLDLRTFTATLRPAYASDLMYTGQGTVQAVATLTNKRVFTVSGAGLVNEGSTHVSGSITTSKIGYGTSIEKIAKTVDFNATMASGTITPSIADSSGTFSDLATVSTDGLSDATANSNRSASHSLKFSFAPTGSTTPVMRDWTLRALPSITKQRLVELPLLTFDTLKNPKGQTLGYPGKARDDLEFLEFLEDQCDVVSVEDLSSRPGSTRKFDAIIESVRHQTTSDDFGGRTTIVLRKV